MKRNKTKMAWKCRKKIAINHNLTIIFNTNDLIFFHLVPAVIWVLFCHYLQTSLPWLYTAILLEAKLQSKASIVHMKVSRTNRMTEVNVDTHKKIFSQSNFKWRKTKIDERVWKMRNVFSRNESNGKLECTTHNFSI